MRKVDRFPSMWWKEMTAVRPILCIWAWYPGMHHLIASSPTPHSQNLPIRKHQKTPAELFKHIDTAKDWKWQRNCSTSESWQYNLQSWIGSCLWEITSRANETGIETRFSESTAEWGVADFICLSETVRLLLWSVCSNKAQRAGYLHCTLKWAK